MARRFSDVEELSSSHHVDAFDCGSDALSIWLREHALQSTSSGMSRVYVVRRLSDDAVVGYHALATGALLQQNAPVRATKGTGRYPLPVIILTRLAVDLSEAGIGIGRALLKDAFMRVNAAADIVGVRALLIHAETEDAARYYMGVAEFERSPTDPLHLVLLLKDLRRALR